MYNKYLKINTYFAINYVVICTITSQKFRLYNRDKRVKFYNLNIRNKLKLSTDIFYIKKITKILTSNDFFFFIVILRNPFSSSLERSSWCLYEVFILILYDFKMTHFYKVTKQIINQRRKKLSLLRQFLTYRNFTHIFKFSAKLILLYDQNSTSFFALKLLKYKSYGRQKPSIRLPRNAPGIYYLLN